MPNERQSQYPVVKDGSVWQILGHPEVVAVATDPVLFSNATSSRRAIPNSLDGEEHRTYRAIVDRYLSPARVAELEPRAVEIAQRIVDRLPRGAAVEAMGQIGVPFAIRSQCAWLGWPQDLEETLVSWMHENRSATRSGNRDGAAAVARAFDAIISRQLDARRDGPPDDVTGRLMRETVRGRPLSEVEIVSILRNWTAGDLGSLADSVGNIVRYLASQPRVQEAVRGQVRAGDEEGVEAALEEILRIDDPFAANRRRATRATDIAGHGVEAGARVMLSWASANRDPRVFGDPDRFDPVGNASDNVVFGAGPHRCPGRALTLMELRVVVDELLTRTSWVAPLPGQPAVRQAPPGGGWARVPVVLR